MFEWQTDAASEGCWFLQLQLAPLSAELSKEDLQMPGDSSSGGAASPLTARSLRLERVAQALAHSQDELRRRAASPAPSLISHGHQPMMHSLASSSSLAGHQPIGLRWISTPSLSLTSNKHTPRLYLTRQMTSLVKV